MLTLRPSSAAWLLAGSFALAHSAAAQTQLVAVPLAGYYDRPSYLCAPLGDDRIFISESSNARILIYESGAPLATPFLDLSGLVSTGFTQGLLCFAFHPRYEDNGYVFVYYTDLTNDVVVARYQVSASDPNLIDPSSATIVITIPEPFVDNSGGQLEFGPEGYLYIGVGDGGGVLDPFCSAQDLSKHLGKILRIDVDAIDSTGSYAIPPSNPFLATSGAQPEIWHYGFAQPWRFSFDRRNGSLWIGEIGENTVEEINRVEPFTGGLNFGWQVMEGDLCTTDFATSSCVPPVPFCNDPSFRPPTFSYPHEFTTWGCAIQGGYVYDGCAIPDLHGSYFFGDFCTTRVWTVDADASGPLVPTDRTAELFGSTTLSNLTSFGRDGWGELYVLDLAGTVYRIEPATVTAVDCPELLAFDGVASIAEGGVQELLLDATQSNAGGLYLVLGSASGTSPGLPLGVGTLPLNFDAYSSFSLSHPNQGPLQASLGLLDGQGRALARFGIPAGMLNPNLVGLGLNHAFVVLAFGPGGATTVQLISNAAELLLQ